MNIISYEVLIFNQQHYGADTVADFIISESEKLQYHIYKANSGDDMVISKTCITVPADQVPVKPKFKLFSFKEIYEMNGMSPGNGNVRQGPLNMFAPSCMFKKHTELDISLIIYNNKLVNIFQIL